MNNERVTLALQNLEVGLHKYEALMTQLHCSNIAIDRDFQRKYNGFFRMQRRTPEFYTFYFSLLETGKTLNNEFDFSYILKKIYEETNRIEASFSSKMLSMINPNYPVWDKYILQNLNLKAPAYTSKNRINKTIEIYNKIVAWYENFMATAEAGEVIERFNSTYPSAKISNIKKIDLVLWQMR